MSGRIMNRILDPLNIQNETLIAAEVNNVLAIKCSNSLVTDSKILQISINLN